MQRRYKILTRAYAVALVAFTAYVLANTFLITQVYAVVEDNGSTTSSASADSETNSQTQASTQTASDDNEASDSNDASEAETSATTYSDDNITVTISEQRVNDTTVYVADVQLSSAEYLQTYLAQGGYGRNLTEKTSAMAEAAGAILAINGDYYGAQESGYVIRNGVLYRSTAKSGQEDLVIYTDGSFEIVCEDDVTAEELVEKSAVQVLSFGPALVQNGSVCVSEGDEVGRAKASNPRTAIGVIDELHYVFVVSDGRTSESEGLSLFELAEYMEGLGVQTAYNLDGGGSSTMVFNGEVVNNPTTSGNSIEERSVSDIVYIGY